ncbi:N-acetylmuramoyl-L-alanine amidase [Rubellimicrobium arenae]|uniref:N-acetylmuramoyl-L-alanine amidase n=1 Tax=Rubellimicrobium arenae TaxID=2817372 RepID=UPI001B30B26A|nr:N-acetylmuramoyl-L-alanine amidase [Rubellimicrobium arenae]
MGFGLGTLCRAAVLAALAGPVAAEGLGGLAHVDLGGSRVEDWGRGIEVTLSLSQAVPWKVFTLDAPRRLVIDFRTIDWTGVDPAELLEPGNATALRVGVPRAGWSRLVVDLDRPLAVAEAGMTVNAGDGTAQLHLTMEVTDEATFTASAETSPEAVAARSGTAAVPAAPDDRFVVAIDPGHGGIDPGAERENLREAQLMLSLARELADAVARAGMVPVLTREDDVFVPLQARMTIARQAGADVLLSLHADALEQDDASGASIYTLTEEAVGQASERMVERHEGGDLLSGLDLKGQDDTVATALMDLARLDTTPRSRNLAAALAAALPKAGAPVNDHVLRQAPLAVLNAADFPSVLIETGFLSDPSDRARLSTAQGRAPLVAGIVAALRSWSDAEEARAPLLRR